MVWLTLKWVGKNNPIHLIMQLDSLGIAFKKLFNEKSVRAEQSEHFLRWENKHGQSCVWPCSKRQNDSLQCQAHKDSAHGSSYPCHLCTPWERGLISLLAPGRIRHSSRIIVNGFCVVPRTYCQHYHRQHCGLIFHQTFKRSLGKWEQISLLDRPQLFPPHLCINKLLL